MTSVDPGRKSVNDGAGLADRKFPVVPVIYVEAEASSLSEERLKGSASICDLVSCLS